MYVLKSNSKPGYSWMMVTAVLASLVVARGSNAEVVLKEPTPVQMPNPVEYPVSEFGKQPADPTTGKFKEEANRAPAGLMMEDLAITEEEEKQRQSELHTEKMKNTNRNSIISNAKRGVQEVAVIAGDMGYFPKTVFVTRDIPVRLYVTGSSKSTLCIMMDSFHVRREVKTKSIAEINFPPSVPGKYRFYCPINGMEGTLIVKELASDSYSAAR
jgi:plastocyanin